MEAYASSEIAIASQIDTNFGPIENLRFVGQVRFRHHLMMTAE